jgi:hypothetical protein
MTALMVGYTSYAIPRGFYAPVAGLRIPENLKETLNLSRGSFVAVNLRPVPEALGRVVRSAS